MGEAVVAAATVCREKGVRFTDLRRRVLELVWEHHRPVGAYDLLDRLRADRVRAAPPTVYRALKFFEEQGLVHRIDSMNAYVGCSTPGALHRAYFLICRRCGQAAEIDDAALRMAVKKAAGRVGFESMSEVIEIKGTCPNCK